MSREFYDCWKRERDNSLKARLSSGKTVFRCNPALREQVRGVVVVVVGGGEGQQKMSFTKGRVWRTTGFLLVELLVEKHARGTSFRILGFL